MSNQDEIHVTQERHLLVTLAKELCDIDSTTGQEAAVVDYIEQWARRRGFHILRQPVGPQAGRDNILITAEAAPVEVLLSTHVDTVPPFIAPRIDEKALWGRGTCDAKGIAACMMRAFENLVSQGVRHIGCLFVVGEETSSDGAKAAAQDFFCPRARYLVNGEPTESKTVMAMKGVLSLELSTIGKAAHSAYPQAGDSALHRLLDDIEKIRHHDWPKDALLGETTLNVGMLSGGVAPNVLAPRAQAQLLFRTISDVDALEKQVRGMLSSKTTVTVSTASSPVMLHTVDTGPHTVVAFGSDIPYLLPALQPVDGKPLLYGPGSILDAHTSHEHVLLDDLYAAQRQYETMVKALLNDD